MACVRDLQNISQNQLIFKRNKLSVKPSWPEATMHQSARESDDVDNRTQKASDNKRSIECFVEPGGIDH